MNDFAKAATRLYAAIRVCIVDEGDIGKIAQHNRIGPYHNIFVPVT